MADANPFALELERRAGNAADNPFAAEIARRASAEAPEIDLPELRSEMGIEAARIAKAGGYEAAGKALKGDVDPEIKWRIDLTRAVSAPRSIQGKFDAVKAIRPDAQLRFADDGTAIVKIGDKDYAINKKGLSSQDLVDLTMEVGTQAPLTMLGAGAGQAALGTVGRVVGAGVGAGAGSLGRDVLGMAFGSEQGFDVTNAAIAAGTSSFFEAVVPAAVNFVARTIQQDKFYKNGALTAAGKAALKRAGIDADALTPEFVDQLKQAGNGRGAVGPEQMAVAQSKSLPQPVPLSKGQVTRDVVALGEESAALKGARGEGPQMMARGFDEGQQQALKANVPGIQKVLRGADDVSGSPAEAIGQVQDTLFSMKQAAKAEIDAAYKTAREGNASVTTEALKKLGGFMRDRLKEGANRITAPKAAALADEFEMLARELPDQTAPATIKSIENWRQAASALSRSSDPVEGTAAGKLVKAFDEYMTTMLDEAAVRGDSAVIAAFKQARELRRTFAQNFEADALVAKILDADRGALTMQPSEAVSELFAGSAIGAKRGSANALAQMKKLLSPEDFAKVKEAAFLRLTEAASKGGEVGVDMASRFSGAEFRRVVDNAFRQSPELMAQLFTKGEQALIKTFRDVALRATTAPAGAVNTSNSAVALERLAGRMGFLGQLGRDAIKTALGPYARTRALSIARQSFDFRPGAPVVAPTPAGAAGAAAVPIGVDINDEIRR